MLTNDVPDFCSKALTSQDKIVSWTLLTLHTRTDMKYLTKYWWHFTVLFKQKYASEASKLYSTFLRKNSSFPLFFSPFLPFKKLFRPLKLCSYSKSLIKISQLKRFTKFSKGSKRFSKAYYATEAIKLCFTILRKNSKKR